MKPFSKIIATALILAGFNTAAQAVILGNLNDGAVHVGSVAGDWSLFANAGDIITVTARRLEPVDIWSFATYGSVGDQSQAFVWGDDQLSPFVGGPWGDPQYTFTAAVTGPITITVDRCCSQIGGALAYNVQATGSTAHIPEGGATLAVLGLTLTAMAGARRKLVRKAGV